MSKEEPKKLVGTPEKRVPKYSNGVLLGSDGRRITITHTYEEDDVDAVVVIERIAIDVDHAIQFADLLNGFIKEVQQGSEDDGTEKNANNEKKEIADGSTK